MGDIQMVAICNLPLSLTHCTFETSKDSAANFHMPKVLAITVDYKKP